VRWTHDCVRALLRDVPMIKTTGIKAVIFDKDGVLVDSEKLKAVAWRDTLETYGVTNGFDWYLRALGPPSVVLATMAIATFGLKADAAKVATEWDARYRLIESDGEPIVQNLQVLGELAESFRIAVASSMDKATIETELRRFGYLKYVSLCISGEEVSNNKPFPDIYVEAAALLKVEPSSCIAVEDSPSGVHAAKAAGMVCFAYKNPLYDLDLSEADMIVTDLRQVEFANFLG